jgi:uncharacterized protein YndB with AHSA1/START domain
MQTPSSGQHITITRRIAAPKEQLIAAWPGVRAVAPDGTEVSAAGTSIPEDAAQAVWTSLVGPEGSAATVRCAASFTDTGDATDVTVRAALDGATPEAEGPLAALDEAWIEALERLDADVTGRPVDSTARRISAGVELPAPPATVWQLWTQPEHVAVWWGPTDYTTQIERMDVRPGGAWLFTMAGPEGSFPNRAVFVDVVEPEQLVFAHGTSGRPDRFVSFVTLEPSADGTRVSVESRFPSPADRQRAADELGASEGLRQTLGNLERYLEEVGRPGIIKMRHDAV